MTSRFTLRQLEYFVAAGEAGSITVASERINVSPPSISAAVSHLEREFGIDLFVRHHAQGLSLTPGGRRFYNEARIVLEKAGSLYDLASDISQSARGPLTVGGLSTLAPMLLAPLRKTFEREHREARITLLEANQIDLFAKLRRVEIDVALTYDMEVPRDIAFEPLVTLPPIIMVAADDPLAKMKSASLEQVAEKLLILLDLPLSREYFLSLFQDAGLKPIIGDRTDNMSMVRSLVANKFGYGLVNFRPKGDKTFDGKSVRYVSLTGKHKSLTIGLATMQSERKAGVLEAFEDHCRKQITAKSVPGMGPV